MVVQIPNNALRSTNIPPSASVGTKLTEDKNSKDSKVSTKDTAKQTTIASIHVRRMEKPPRRIPL